MASRRYLIRRREGESVFGLCAGMALDDLREDEIAFWYSEKVAEIIAACVAIMNDAGDGHCGEFPSL